MQERVTAMSDNEKALVLASFAGDSTILGAYPGMDALPEERISSMKKAGEIRSLPDQIP